jgi:hypothetical protein
MYFRLTIILLLSVATFIPMRALAVDMPMTESSLSREQRLSNAVSEQHLVLDENAKSLLAQKCKNAQTILVQIQDKTQKLVLLRSDTYGGIQKELLALKLRMARQGADASEIDLLIGKLQQKLDQFTLAANTYGTSLDDVITVDCAQKPEQFKAGLIVLRAQRSDLESAAQNLRHTMESARRNTFDQLKNRLRV